MTEPINDPTDVIVSLTFPFEHGPVEADYNALVPEDP